MSDEDSETDNKGQRVELDTFQQPANSPSSSSSSSSPSSPESPTSKHNDKQTTLTKDFQASIHDDDPIIVLPSLFDSLEKQVKDLRRRVFKYSKATSLTRDRKKKKAEESMTRTKELLFHVEQVYHRADEQQQIVYEVDLNRMKNRVLKLDRELEELKDQKPLNNDRDRLLIDVHGHGGRNNKMEGAPSPLGNLNQDGEIMLMTKRAPSPMQHIIDLQSENLHRLEGMIDLNEDTIQIGQRAAARLKAQRERMELIDRDVAEIGTGMKRAKREMRSLYRNLACSKFIIVLLIVAGLLAVAVLITNIVLQAFGIQLIGPNSVIANLIKKRKEQKKEPAQLQQSIESIGTFLVALGSYFVSLVNEWLN